MSLKNLSPAVKNTLIFLGFATMVFIIYQISHIISPFLISLIIAYVLSPLVEALTKRNMSRQWAVFTVFIIVFTIFVIFVVPLSMSIFSEAGKMVDKLGGLDSKQLASNYSDIGKDLYNKLSKIPYLKPYLDDFIQSEKIREYAAQGIIYVKNGLVIGFKNFLSFLVSAFSGMVNMFLIPILTFYILLDIEEIFGNFKLLIPVVYRERLLNILSVMNKQLNCLFRGQVFSNSIFAVLMTISLWFAGLNFSLFLGPLSGIANFIPYLGGLFTLIVATLIAITQFGFSKAIGFLILKVLCAIGFVQTVDAWYLQPYIVGENAGLKPLVVMLALTIAGSLGGITGLLLAVPVTIILKVIGKELYHELYDPV